MQQRRLNTFAYVAGNPIRWIDPLGLDIVYDQQTGQISQQPSAAQGGGPPLPIGNGYSGNGQGLNNPSAQNQPNVGPIPQGTYGIGQQTNSPNTGPGILPLTPQPGTNTHGRDSFQVHGDNSQGNQSASQGCIVTDRITRNRISGDNILIVQ